MTESRITINRLPIRLVPDPHRTFVRFFWLDKVRSRKIIQRIESLEPARISEMVNQILQQFTPGNPGLEEILLEHYEKALHQTGYSFHNDFEIKLLIGAFHSMEYAFESAALFNPSMVPAIRQPDLDQGRLRFVMSLRAIGEGHISSITFRRGEIDLDGNVMVNPCSREVRQVKQKKNRTFEKTVFINKLRETDIWNQEAKLVMEELPDTFSTFQLQHQIERYKHTEQLAAVDQHILDLMLWIGHSEYEIEKQNTDNLENLVLFPLSQTESQGMEDMRLVRFDYPDGSLRYFGTYSAFNGRRVLPQILELAPDEYAVVHILHGKYARNKGMALFPQKIDDQYAAIGRADGENMFLLKSDDFDFWDDAIEIITPRYAWEFVQIGNCGSPLLTEAGWLLLTHGVGAMRKYCIGAVLLDKDDPSKIIGQLPTPLLSPNEEERSGYVPNVLYSCGGLIHGNHLLIPYGISDSATGFAIINLQELLSELT